MVNKFGQLYDTMSNGLVRVDSLAAFYFELYTHIDGSLRDLVRSKLSSLFVPQLRDNARGSDLKR